MVCCNIRTPLFTLTSSSGPSEELAYANVANLIFYNMVGDTQAVLCTFLCGNIVPPITRQLKAQILANCCPFSFLNPGPCFPMTLSISVLSSHNFSLNQLSSRSRLSSVVYSRPAEGPVVKKPISANPVLNF